MFRQGDRRRHPRPRRTGDGRRGWRSRAGDWLRRVDPRPAWQRHWPTWREQGASLWLRLKTQLGAWYGIARERFGRVRQRLLDGGTVAGRGLAVVGRRLVDWRDRGAGWIEGFRQRVAAREQAPTGCRACQGLREAWAAARDRWAQWREPAPPQDVAEEGTYSHLFQARRYPRSRNRNYLVHVPPGYDGDSAVPLVMVLHGCRQTHRDIRRVSNFEAMADKHGFITVYPFITSYGGLRFRNCWGFWYPRETVAGAGEVEDLWQIIEEVRGNYRIDAQRIHVVGLSSGAGMTAALLVAHAGGIASGAVVAGVPYSETAAAIGFLKTSHVRLKPVYQVAAAMRHALQPGVAPIPIFIVHSHQDETVNIQAARNIRDSWGHCFGIDTLNPTRTRSGVTRGTPWVHKAYGTQPGRSLIETYFISGKGHGWYGGRPGPYSYPDAPDIARRIWLFFDRHRR